MWIVNKIRYKLFINKWQKSNNNFATFPKRIFPIKQVSVGQYTYGSFDVYLFNDINKLVIGNFVSIGPEVIFNVSADHNTETISTYPYVAHVIHSGKEGISKGDIVVEDDVWIGSRAIILSGVHIGQGAVIAAGAVVTKEVKPYSIVGGVPAKVIKNRFSDEVIDYMLTLDYSQLTKEAVITHSNDFNRKIDEMSLAEIKNMYNWFPKKSRKE